MTVSISHRIFDTVGSTATPEDGTSPATACILLRDLGMSHACVEKQKAALHTWLMIHEAPRQLRISLRENGFGLLLKQTDGQRARQGGPA